jgi:hypothetical protein
VSADLPMQENHLRKAITITDNQRFRPPSPLSCSGVSHAVLLPAPPLWGAAGLALQGLTTKRIASRIPAPFAPLCVVFRSSSVSLRWGEGNGAWRSALLPSAVWRDPTSMADHQREARRRSWPKPRTRTVLRFPIARHLIFSIYARHQSNPAAYLWQEEFISRTTIKLCKPSYRIS